MSWNKNPASLCVTYHKLDPDFICDIFKAFKADHDLVLGVVQISQMQHDDLITFL